MAALLLSALFSVEAVAGSALDRLLAVGCDPATGMYGSSSSLRASGAE
jgi:hypothetical protein